MRIGIDIDGTLAAYRFNGHVADSNGTDNEKTKNLSNDEFIKEINERAKKFSKYLIVLQKY